MPVRSLHSSVLRWPDRNTVDEAVRCWAATIASEHPEVVRIGYFGSYARDQWGVGSDVDIVILVDHAESFFVERAASWDRSTLPVPADLLVYTVEEWRGMDPDSRFGAMLLEETVWVYPRTSPSSFGDF